MRSQNSSNYVLKSVCWSKVTSDFYPSVVSPSSVIWNSLLAQQQTCHTQEILLWQGAGFSIWRSVHLSCLLLSPCNLLRCSHKIQHCHDLFFISDDSNSFIIIKEALESLFFSSHDSNSFSLRVELNCLSTWNRCKWKSSPCYQVKQKMLLKTQSPLPLTSPCAKPNGTMNSVFTCFLESRPGKFLAARFCESFLCLQINCSLLF